MTNQSTECNTGVSQKVQDAGSPRHSDHAEETIKDDELFSLNHTMAVHPGWVGHAFFAGLLMKEFRPQLFVELGAYYGNSYFAFCQSAKKNNVGVRCYGIDSWAEEAQDGKNEEEFKTVNDYNEANYSPFSTLLRGKSDDFADRFEDASIDLLHIDGSRSYDAVKHAFQTWIDKVRPGGIVFFHDVVTDQEGSGVFRFWKEISPQTTERFLFTHSHGIGVWRKPGGQELSSPVLRGMFSSDWKIMDAVHEHELEEWSGAYNELSIQSEHLQNQMAMLQDQLTTMQQENMELVSSNFYRVFNKLRNLYLRLFPDESRRGRLMEKAFLFGVKFYKGMKNGFRFSMNSSREYRVKDPGKRFFKPSTGRKLVIPAFETPRVSIIIPVYNQFLYTYFCIKSVIENAGDVPYEIILADDCSTDETKRIADRISNIKVCKTDRNVRFLLNCNQAAETARGEFIVFLNNDTVVHPGWLQSLVETMDNDPKVGIAGAKLVYAKGCLQEAGGIVFRDASAWNYGNGENPNLPEYNYLKECDYTSGASLMIRTALWKEIGGFDERFVPAYYEDTDLCFEARRHGFKVVYQPKAVVTHFEGRSNGTDVSCGVKKYQVDNQKKFADKWQKELARHCHNGDNVFTARDRSSGKQHVFMLDHYIPTFDRDAGSRQMYCYVKILQKLGYMIHLLGDNRFHDEPYTSAFQQLGVEVLYGNEYDPNHLRKWFRDNSRFISYAFLNRAHIAINYFPLIRLYSNIKLIYYGHDVGHIRLQRAYEVSGDQSLLPLIKSTKSQEMALYSSSDANMCVGDFEYAYLKKAVPNIPLYNMPIFIYDRFIESCEPFENRKDLLFVGGFNHPPNKDGILWFVKDILPMLTERIPDIRLHIVGSNMPNEIKKLAGKQISVHGFVSDEELTGLYRFSRVVIAPLRFGAGVKGKIIEALYNRSVVVTTSIGAEGIPSENNPFAIADTPEAFAQAVLSAYTDCSVWDTYLRNSQELIKSVYSYEKASGILLDVFSKKTGFDAKISVGAGV